MNPFTLLRKPEVPKYRDTFNPSEHATSILELCQALESLTSETAQPPLAVELEGSRGMATFSISDESVNETKRKFLIEELGAGVSYTLSFGENPADSVEASPILLAKLPTKHASLMAEPELVRALGQNVSKALEQRPTDQ